MVFLGLWKAFEVAMLYEMTYVDSWELWRFGSLRSQGSRPDFWSRPLGDSFFANIKAFSCQKSAQGRGERGRRPIVHLYNILAAG